MFEYTALRWLLRYKIFFVIGLLILGVQFFLAYKSEHISLFGGGINSNLFGESDALLSTPHWYDDEEAQAAPTKRPTRPSTLSVSAEELGFIPECEVTSKDAISALLRARTKDCRKHIMHIACAIQEGSYYPRQLFSNCSSLVPMTNSALGCYVDDRYNRLLSGYSVELPNTNSPNECIKQCRQLSFLYAGVQYGIECHCGNDEPPRDMQTSDSSCSYTCPGDTKEICGAFYRMNIYATGVEAKFKPQIAETAISDEGVRRVRIAFLLTLNGRALRQVHRLIRMLYAPEHVFYIHIDERQVYLHRKLLALEKDFPNIRLAPKRFSTIWGGASLLTMLLQCMTDLLESSFEWDFVINLSESDFPVKTVDKLVDFLTANKGRNFVRGHGRDTKRFIQKQGLDKTFVECDTHMWRIGDRQLPMGIQIDGGSDWIALSRPFVEYLINHAKTDPTLKGLLQIFRYTLLPAESFFHTVLRNTHFCHTYVDNNLHVTNWKRKLGCKCQYKHVVDWCGCSPNDFKPSDWSRLLGTHSKQLFFARKFEPIINQAVITQLEEWVIGVDHNFTNVHGYWQSFYDATDPITKQDDIMRTIGESVMRIMARTLRMHPEFLYELTHYLHRDQYKGFLVRYKVHDSENLRDLELETRVRPVQYFKFSKTLKFAKRLRSFVVSSDFDVKEQVLRNFAKMLGPRSDPVLSFTFLGLPAASVEKDAAHSYNLTLLWIDPLGRLQDFTEVHVEDSAEDVVYTSKPTLKHPMAPGSWTVKLIGRIAIYAQTQFLITPLAFSNIQPIVPTTAHLANGGVMVPAPKITIPKEWQSFVRMTDAHLLEKEAEKANHVGDELLVWIDELVKLFYHTRETCSVSESAIKVSTPELDELPSCADTTWSSLASDPKSDVYALLKKPKQKS